MGIDAHVSCCTRKTLAFSIRDVLLCLWIPILLCHAKINHKHLVGNIRIRSTDKKVVWLDISVDEITFMDTLNSADLSHVLIYNRARPLIQLVSDPSSDQQHTMLRANMATVLTLNRREHMSNKSSRLGPSKSRTNTLYIPSCPK